MPYCEVRRGDKKEEDGIRIFYRTYGRGSTKVLLITGLAGTHAGWKPQVKGLVGTDLANDKDDCIWGVDRFSEDEKIEGGIEVCCFDNRGMGQSSVPTKKSEYTTSIMAKDALALLDHLGWEKAHVSGHSMGSMIACKLAAMAPHRLSSLALFNATGGGYECFPKVDRQMISLALRFLRAKTPEERAMVDLETHYTKEYLDEDLGSSTRRQLLYQQYVRSLSSNGVQTGCGFEGQANACWKHNMAPKELDVIRSAGFPIFVIHGRYDIVAQVCHARKLANDLKPMARMIELHGAHLVTHERQDEVNHYILKLIKASETKRNLQKCLSLSKSEKGLLTLSSADEDKYMVTRYNVMAKLQLRILFLLGVFIMSFEQARRALRTLKPVRVGVSL